MKEDIFQQQFAKLVVKYADLKNSFILNYGNKYYNC